MWLARDKDGRLIIYNTKPIKYDNLGAWGDINQNIKYMVLDDSKYDLFPEVKWSDKEPRELVLKPINEEQGFVNLYKDGGQVKVGWKIFPTKKEAEENFKDDEKYITTANIQWRDSNDNL